MKTLKITNVPAGSEKVLFKLFRENGFKIGTNDSSDETISGEMVINRFNGTVYLATSNNDLTLHFNDLNISILVDWIKNKACPYDKCNQAFDFFIDEERKTLTFILPERFSNYQVFKH